ncbi:MAG: hypothetical protein VW270_20770, partial [Candidatus Poseidoniales archaeon]
SDPAGLPYHGDVYVALFNGVVDSSWNGLFGDSVNQGDVLLFDSNQGDGSLGSGEWMKLGAAGGGTGIIEVRDGFGIDVDLTQPNRPMVLVDSDDLATKFLRLETADEDAKDQFFLLNQTSSTHNKLTAPTTINVHGASGNILKIKNTTSSAGEPLFQVLNNFSSALLTVDASGNLTRDTNLAGRVAGDNSFIDKTFADSAYFGKIGDQTLAGQLEVDEKLLVKTKGARSASESPPGTEYFDTGIIIAEGYRTAASGIAARLTLSNKVDAQAYGSLEWHGLTGDSAYFKFTHDVAFNSKGIHSVDHIRLNGDRTIQYDNSTYGKRIKLTTSGMKILRPMSPSSVGGGFQINGQDSAGNELSNGLLQVYHNRNGNNGDIDAVNYYGKTVGNSNIMNRAAIQELIDSTVSAIHPHYVFEYTTSFASDGQFRAFAASTARKIQIGSKDIYGRTTPNHTATNGFHIDNPWVTIEYTTTGMLVFGARLKYGHPSYTFKDRNFFYDTSDIQYQDITITDGVPQLVVGRNYILRCAGIL